MPETSVLLTALSEARRTQALERFAIIRPALEDGITQAQVARTHELSPSTVQLWIKRYREKGLAGLANHVARSDKGTSRKLPTSAIQLVEGLALQTIRWSSLRTFFDISHKKMGDTITVYLQTQIQCIKMITSPPSNPPPALAQ